MSSTKRVMEWEGGGGRIIFDENTVQIERDPVPPPAEPQYHYSEKMLAKTKAEIEGGKAALVRQQERLNWARDHEAKRQKLPSEIKSEIAEAAAQGKNLTFNLAEGGLMGKNTVEGNIRKDASNDPKKYKVVG